ncbi:HAMP domain-containing histidine kinase [Bacteroides salyersiae]|nr:HAMP domain-containing histidine kinase [Bacteroides salyersiae]
MRKLLKYLLLGFCALFLAGNATAATDAADQVGEDTALRGKIIQSFRNSLGFNVLEEKDSSFVYADSLLDILELHEQFDSYFELSRIIIKSQILKGKMGMAIAHSDRMYSKARVLKDVLGMALSLNAIGEIYTAIGREREAGDAYERSLALFEEYGGGETMKKILLVELAEYNLRMKDIGAMAKYVRLLNQYSTDSQSELEQTVMSIFNAYYKIHTGALEEADSYLEKVRKQQDKLIPGLLEYFLVAEAYYLEQSNALEKALEIYDYFFSLKHAGNNYELYISTMEKKAQLLEKMGRKEEAFTLYNTIYSYINSKFKANYPKEIDQLCARFEADQLTYQITQDRNRSLRYYTIAIGGCALVLALFIFLSWRKIFRLKQSKQKMEEMNRKAENAIRKKNLFLSNMSHEVRTPLNAIVGFSTLMASEEIEVDEVSRKEYCEIIRINSYQLLKLINDIIDFSDFDEDNISMTIKGQDAVKICREVIETVAASYKLQVELRFDTSLTSLMIDTDDSRLRQVLINLLVNATKFTTQGSIVLRLERSIDDADMALFSVTDTGCGIPLEKQKLIFERFEKLNDFVQGTGLGLSICLLILKRLKGKIWIDDKYTEGARFCFLHPLKSESKLI